MLGRKVVGFPNAYRLEQPSVLPQYIITSRPQYSTLADLPPRLEVIITEVLTKMAQEFHQPEGLQ